MKNVMRGKVLRWTFRLVLGATAVFLLLWVSFPFPVDRLPAYPASTVVTDRAGVPLRYLLGPGEVDCRPIYTPRPEDWIAKAIVAAEDQRFWSHPGIDPLALVRALGQNLRSGRKISGASTLSTQVIRLLDPRPRNLWTKAVEAFRALQLEALCTKEEILAQYLNRAPFGGNLLGIEAAARYYFGKGGHDLSLAEAALLAGLPQSPSRLRPDRHPEAARRRMNYVLERMSALHLAPEPVLAAARRQPLHLLATLRPFLAPHAVDAALRRRPGRSGEVRTTLDAGLQAQAEALLAGHVRELEREGIHGGALVVIEVASGAVRAMAGSPDFFNERRQGQVNGALAVRPAGSTLKPLAYAAGFDRGTITPAWKLADVPMTFRDYRPANFDPVFHGPVRARDALLLSLNMPALQLVEQVGLIRFHATLRSLGLDTVRRAPSFYGLGLVLGNAGVRLVDLANAYAALARGGDYRPWRLFEDEPLTAGHRVFSPAASWLVAEALGGEERAMDATPHQADVVLPRIAWKTGTSAGLRDAWTLAWNPEYVVGVWVGNPDGGASPALVGKRVAAPVAWALFRQLYPRGEGPWFARPAEVRRRAVCSLSGQSVGPHCPHGEEDWYIAGVSQATPCRVHREAAEPGQEAPATWPPAVATFLAGQGDGPAPAHESAVRIVSPAGGAIYRRLPGWPDDPQQLALQGAGGAELFWYIDSDYLGRGDRVFWPLQPGRHRIVLADARGRSDRVEILVE